MAPRMAARPSSHRQPGAGADDDDAGDGVRDAHQRRVGAGATFQILPADEAGEHEDREVLDEVGKGEPGDAKMARRQPHHP